MPVEGLQLTLRLLCRCQRLSNVLPGFVSESCCLLKPRLSLSWLSPVQAPVLGRTFALTQRLPGERWVTPG